MDTDSSPSESNEGSDMMDEMENRLSVMGLGETGYLVMTGAICAGASGAEAFDVLTAFFVAGLMTNRSPEKEEEEDDETATEE